MKEPPKFQTQFRDKSVLASHPYLDIVTDVPSIAWNATDSTNLS